MKTALRRILSVSTCCVFQLAVALADEPSEPPDSIRVASYNISFYRDHDGQLQEDLERGDEQAREIAEVLQRVRPDVVLLNEFDYDADQRGAELFCNKYLEQSQNGQSPVVYAHRFTAPVNTGEPSALDLDQDGRSDGAGDAYGWGRYPGQYGMLVLSRFPIDHDQVRTFRHFLWKHMPNAKAVVHPDTGEPYYDSTQLDAFRLSSKSHWDVPILVPAGDRIVAFHLLCSHPTPPVFDGPENRNGLRNHDEIRLLADYVDPQRSGYVVDDHGRRGGLAGDAIFVIAGDLNADPVDGDSSSDNIRQLLEHPRVNAKSIPQSSGASQAAASRRDLNGQQKGQSRYDTADFSGDEQGNLRVDYVLPSQNVEIASSGVYWPTVGKPGHKAVQATDHRLVYVDLRFRAQGKGANRDREH